MSSLKIPEGARLAGKFPGDWALYELRPRADDSPLWLQFKVMRSPGTRAKWGQTRQYYLRWNPDEQRFRRDGQRVAIETNEPELYLRVETHMSLCYGPDWLKANQGMSDAEIAAERNRLAASRRTTGAR